MLLYIGLVSGQYDYYSSYYYYTYYSTYPSYYYYYTYDTTEATKEPPTTPKPTLPTTLATTTPYPYNYQTDLRPNDFGKCVLFIIKLCITEGIFVKARGSSTPVNALNPYYLNSGSSISFKNLVVLLICLDTNFNSAPEASSGGSNFLVDHFMGKLDFIDYVLSGLRHVSPPSVDLRFC